MAADTRPSVGVVGLGLIGGSVGLALRNPKRVVLGCDAYPDAERIALERFCVDRIAPIEEVSKCDVVFIGAPPGRVIEVAQKVHEHKTPATVVTDCASVKSEIAQWAFDQKLKNFVPGHPMAGHEKSGSTFASAWMFKGARWLLTPCSTTSALAVKTVEKLIAEMGAVPIRLEPEEHDRHVAILSHLPHVIAGGLLLQAENLPHLEVGAGSWRDLTRVGGVDPGLWAQIFRGNQKELTQVIDEFQSRLDEFKNRLGDEDDSGLLEWLAKVQQVKKVQEPLIPGSPGRPAAARPQTGRTMKRSRG